MRNAFAAQITALSEVNSEIVLLSGDIGNRLFNPFKEKFPHRFFNCGVAEANMTGMAAGMAMCGLRPVTYTITPFNTARCLEQIRIDICYQNLPVIVVGVGAGLAYAGLGGTHQSCDDIALLRVMPNMTIICPGDAVEVRFALSAALETDGPVYIRLGKKNEPLIHHIPPSFQIGKGIILQKGMDVCMLSAGNILPVAVEAADMLTKQGISTQVISMHTVKPLDTDLLSDVFSQFNIVASIEEHSLIGGFGAAIAEWLSDQPPLKGSLYRIGAPDRFIHGAGDQNNARKILGFTPEDISNNILLHLKQNQ